MKSRKPFENETTKIDYLLSSNVEHRVSEIVVENGNDSIRNRETRGGGDSMEIELPGGRRRRKKKRIREREREREVQVDANGRPLFFLLCFPLDQHCSCNVAGPGAAHQLTLSAH